MLGAAESFIITGGVAWGLALAGGQNSGKVIAWIGMAMFAALALGAPIGSALYEAGGFAAIALATMVLPPCNTARHSTDARRQGRRQRPRRRHLRGGRGGGPSIDLAGTGAARRGHRSGPDRARLLAGLSGPRRRGGRPSPRGQPRPCHGALHRLSRRGARLRQPGARPDRRVRRAAVRLPRRRRGGPSGFGHRALASPQVSPGKDVTASAPPLRRFCRSSDRLFGQLQCRGTSAHNRAAKPRLSSTQVSPVTTALPSRHL
ncbi:hypothetical protein [Mesorhizobium sp. M00.F.Ca.ET.217.01.1.1]|uniref:hypothetical protein n=1 Tax=Mesorhizobium sp. M00.F.Ca.ET.217.01.1.1 TaxID=2500529 RepID=UPI0034D24C45